MREVLNIAVVTAPDFLDQVLVGDDQSDMRGQRMKERVNSLESAGTRCSPCKVTILDTKIDRKAGPGFYHRVSVGATQNAARNAASLRASSSEIPNGLTT